jgi:hypothetical protein
MPTAVGGTRQGRSRADLVVAKQPIVITKQPIRNPLGRNQYSANRAAPSTTQRTSRSHPPWDEQECRMLRQALQSLGRDTSAISQLLPRRSSKAVRLHLRSSNQLMQQQQQQQQQPVRMRLRRSRCWDDAERSRVLLAHAEQQLCGGTVAASFFSGLLENPYLVPLPTRPCRPPPRGLSDAARDCWLSAENVASARRMGNATPLAAANLAAAERDAVRPAGAAQAACRPARPPHPPPLQDGQPTPELPPGLAEGHLAMLLEGLSISRALCSREPPQLTLQFEGACARALRCATAAHPDSPLSAAITRNWVWRQWKRLCRLLLHGNRRRQQDQRCEQWSLHQKSFLMMAVRHSQQQETILVAASQEWQSLRLRAAAESAARSTATPLLGLRKLDCHLQRRVIDFL